MTEPSPDAASSLSRIVSQIHGARLTGEDWTGIERLLAAVERSADDAAIEDLGAAVFEAKVRRRFAAGRSSTSIPPTKQTSVLPVVGAVCASALFGVGALLGGGLILVGIGVLSVGVFAVAFAGSRVAHRRPVAPGPAIVVESPPPAVVAACARLVGRDLSPGEEPA